MSCRSNPFVNLFLDELLNFLAACARSVCRMGSNYPRQPRTAVGAMIRPLFCPSEASRPSLRATKTVVEFLPDSPKRRALPLPWKQGLQIMCGRRKNC